MKPYLTYLLFLTASLSACQSTTTTTQTADTTAQTESPVTPELPKSAPANSPPSTSTVVDFLIVPGERVGPITANTSEADLLRLLGPSVVTIGDTLYGAEGETFPGTTLYKGTADEVQVFHSDSADRRHPTSVRVTPQFVDNEGNSIPNMAPSRWVTTTGIRIGSTLTEVEQLNGKPFKLWGFEWDYSGLVSNWQGGKLTPPDKKAFLSMSFSAPMSRTLAQEKAYAEVMGDGEFLSSGAAMQRLNPIVMRLETAFN